MSMTAAPGRLVGLLRRSATRLDPMPMPVPPAEWDGTLSRGVLQLPDPRRPRGRVRVPRTASRVIGTVYALAWIACPAIEPVPNGPEPSYELWQVPIDLLAIGSIVAACVALWVGSRWGARLGVVAGLGMIAETVTCPGSGHHLVGWYTWVQAALSLAVLASSVALLAFSTPAPGRESYAGR